MASRIYQSLAIKTASQHLILTNLEVLNTIMQSSRRIRVNQITSKSMARLVPRLCSLIVWIRCMQTITQQTQLKISPTRQTLITINSSSSIKITSIIKDHLHNNRKTKNQLTYLRSSSCSPTLRRSSSRTSSTPTLASKSSPTRRSPLLSISRSLSKICRQRLTVRALRSSRRSCTSSRRSSTTPWWRSSRRMRSWSRRLSQARNTRVSRGSNRLRGRSSVRSRESARYMRRTYSRIRSAGSVKYWGRSLRGRRRRSSKNYRVL